MKRTCGNCRYAQPDGPDMVLCFGAPPTVTKAEVIEQGTRIESHVPLLMVTRRPCALHGYSWFKRK